MGQDLRFALRQWRLRPWFTAAIIGMLALGIAATTSVFAVAYAELWRPAPWKDAGRLVSLETHTGPVFAGFTPSQFQSVSALPGFSGLAGVTTVQSTLVAGRRALRTITVRITPNLIPLLGVRPELGRGFLPSESAPGRDAVVVISDALWRSELGGNARILGQTIKLDQRLYTVVGVMPPDFEFGTFGANAVNTVWTPMVFTSEELRETGIGPVEMVGRLAPGKSWKQVEPMVSAYAARLHWKFRGEATGIFGYPLLGLWHDRQAQAPLLALLGAVGLVLLIACANVAGLLLAQGVGREQEMGVRHALGASRVRLARQLLTEGALLAAAAAGLGLALAHWGVAVLRASPLSGELFHLQDARVGHAVVGFAIAAAILVALLCSLMPALRQARLTGTHSLSSRSWARSAVLTAEVALSFALLISAGLMANSMVRISSAPTGVDLSHLAAVEFNYTPQQDANLAALGPVGERMLAAARLPGIRRAALASGPPLDNLYFLLYRLPPSPKTLDGEMRSIGSGYFATVGQRLLQGRDIAATDTQSSPHVAVVNQAWARAHAPHRSPVGMRFTRTRHGQTTDYTIVGMVSDARDIKPDALPEPEIYLPLTQLPTEMALVVNAAHPAEAAEALRRSLARALPDLPIAVAQPVSGFYGADIATSRFQQAFVIVFAALALLFALAGIWAQVAFAVSRRQREFGIRMVLGAEGNHLLWQALRQVAALAGIGIGVGLAGAWAAARLLRTLLYGVQATDPATFGAVTAVFAAVALAAAYIPARRALGANPSDALRCE